MASITQFKNLYAFVDNNSKGFFTVRLEQLLCLPDNVLYVDRALEFDVVGKKCSFRGGAQS